MKIVLKRKNRIFFRKKNEFLQNFIISYRSLISNYFIERKRIHLAIRNVEKNKRLNDLNNLISVLFFKIHYNLKFYNNRKILFLLKKKESLKDITYY